MDIVLTVSGYIGAIGVIITAINKLLDNKIVPLSTKIDNSDRRQLRYEIVSFANSLHSGDKRTKEEFEAIFEFCDRYEEIVEEHKIKNNLFEQELEYIKGCYKKI